MKIYVVYLFDSGILTAFRVEQEAIDCLWEEYINHYQEKGDYIDKYGEEDRDSLENYGYITDFGSVEPTYLQGV